MPLLKIQHIAPLLKIAPLAALYLDGLIKSNTTKEELLALFLTVTGKTRIPEPLKEVMEVIVPGFTDFFDFETRLRNMSEEDLDRKLSKVLLLVQSGRFLSFVR